MTIEQWIEEYNLDATIDGCYVIVNGFGKLLLLSKKDFTLNNECSLQLSEQEYQDAENVDFLLFELGEKFYYSDKIDKPDFSEFKNIGKVKTLFPQVDFPFLGLHGGYELCNGSRLYTDWCKKAKFLNISTLGLAEEGTLAGVVSFQKACEKFKIKSIVGESVKVESLDGTRYTVKLFCKDREDGWTNLLQINTILNCTSTNKVIKEEDLLTKTKGLICILTTDVNITESLLQKYLPFEDRLFFGLDFTEWDAQDRDKLSLYNIQNYFKNYQDKLKPVLVSDAYYLDKQDSKITKTLASIGHINFKNYSKNQYLKNIDDYLLEGVDLFKDEEQCFELITQSILNTIEAFEGIDVKVITGNFYLPRYPMTEKESKEFKTNEGLLWSMLERGLKEKVISKNLDEKIYRERLDYEMDVIKRGGFIDYFLILADVYRFADENDIWYGIGRGSSAGSCVAYLTNITGVDPLQFGLLFERFLNEGRIAIKKNKECVILTHHEYGEVVLDMYEKVIIVREGVEIECVAKNLRQNDVLVRSNHRELFN